MAGEERYHVISAKYQGWANEGEDFYFPVSSYSKEDAIAQFVPVEKFTERNNRMVPYTAYEYDGNTFYTVIYSGVVNESELKYY
ncbi:hypothetical protein [Lacrimispora indolis]|uniref:hypothetical protein n=1 Tax=Lacrimispora indolis TaxID=69825 RepID=UPI00045E6CC5|nr:hypothetical protein [Lacrimispora indolis]